MKTKFRDVAIIVTEIPKCFFLKPRLLWRLQWSAAVGAEIKRHLGTLKVRWKDIEHKFYAENCQKNTCPLHIFVLKSKKNLKQNM